MSLFTKVFGTYSDRQVKKIEATADKIEALGGKYAAMSDAELRAQTEPDTAAVAYADVGAAPRRTLYSYVGDAVLYLACAFVLMCLLWAYIEKRTEKKHDRNQTAQQTGV